jgi:hypothetical protein
LTTSRDTRSDVSLRGEAALRAGLLRKFLRNGVNILAELPNLNLTREAKSIQRSIDVVARFCLRLSILVVFSAFGSIGFDRSLTVLLWMSTILSAVLATLEREEPLGPVLNHWDETTAYAALCCLIGGFGHSV